MLYEFYRWAIFKKYLFYCVWKTAHMVFCGFPALPLTAVRFSLYITSPPAGRIISLQSSIPFKSLLLSLQNLSFYYTSTSLCVRRVRVRVRVKLEFLCHVTVTLNYLIEYRSHLHKIDLQLQQVINWLSNHQKIHLYLFKNKIYHMIIFQGNMLIIFRFQFCIRDDLLF